MNPTNFFPSSLLNSPLPVPDLPPEPSPRTTPTPKPQYSPDHSFSNAQIICGCPTCATLRETDQATLAESTDFTAIANLNLSDTFKLHSNPDAKHTVYLDFTGHITQGTPWNDYFKKSSINSPAYDNDGNPNSFSNAELALIQRVWLRVAEDFAPFDVNITTEEPTLGDLIKSGSNDTRWGTRVVITKDTEQTGAGGIAYIDSFNWNTDTPAWVYNQGEIGVAAAVSHEIGHTLGLAHDGTSNTTYYNGHGSGETGWGPIMGSGYAQNVTTWDNGTYYNTNNGGTGANYGSGADDLAVITTQNGFSYRADDHGNNFSNASNFTIDGNSGDTLQISQFGLIERRTDKDYFAFTTGVGNISLDFNSYFAQAFVADGNGGYTGRYLPTPFDGNGSSNDQGSNLDIQAKLFNANQTLIATSNPTGLSASFTDLFLSAGDYYVEVDGVGFGNPTTSSPTGYSDYGSLGQYYISGSIIQPDGNGGGGNDNGNVPAVEITDFPDLIVEGLTTNQQASYTVSLDTASNQAITVEYTTQNGSALAGSDYTNTTGVLTFNPGETTQAIAVPILDNNLNEADETFTLALADPTNATLGNTTEVTTTITDTLTTSVTKTLPFRVENLTLTGSNNINATGNNRNNIIIGNSGNNIIKGQNGLDELTGMGGNDLFDLAGIKVPNHRKTITDFANGAPHSGSLRDRLGVSANLTSRAGSGAPVLQTVTKGSSVTLDVANADIFALAFDQTEADVDLGTATNGSELLDGLNSAQGGANLLTPFSNAQGYLLAYDNDNAYLYYFSSNSDTIVKPWEIRLITTLDSPGAIAVGALNSGHFTLT